MEYENKFKEAKKKIYDLDGCYQELTVFSLPSFDKPNARFPNLPLAGESVIIHDEEATRVCVPPLPSTNHAHER